MNTRKEYEKEYYEKNKERIKARVRAHRYKYIEKHREQQRRYRKENPDKVRDSKMKSFYGIGLDRYNELVLEQNNKCAICRNEETIKDNRTGLIKKLSVDHCHDTGIIRGLLCNNCNRAMGLFRDDPDILRKAILYLENRHV